MQAYVFLRSFSFSVLYLLLLLVDSFLIRGYGSWSKFKSAQASAASVFGACLGFRVLHMQQAVGQFNGTPSPNAHYVFSLSFQVSTLQSQEA
jgi:hypothetical protein